MNKIVYRNEAVGAKESATQSSAYMTGTTPSEIFDDTQPVDYISLDGNGMDLTDTTSVFYASTDISGFVSSAASDAAGNSAATLTVSFWEDKIPNGTPVYCTSGGVTIRFFQDYCKKVRITYYNGDTQLTARTYDCAELEHFFEAPGGVVADYTKVKIEFLETEQPHQLVKVAGIYFGKDVTLDCLYSLTLMEQINLTGEDLSMNALDVSLESEETLLLQETQMFRAYNNGEPLGEFYIDTSTQDTDTKYTVGLDDAASILDRAYFLGGIYHTDYVTYANDVVTQIADQCGVKIEMDAVYDTYTLLGWIPYDTCRKALLLIAFAIGAVVHVGRDGVIRLMPFNKNQTAKTIGGDRIIGVAKFERGTPVTGVELVQYDYRSQDDWQTVFETDVEIRENVTVYHDKPMADAQRYVDGSLVGILQSSAPNRCIIPQPILAGTTVKRKVRNEYKTVLSKHRTTSGKTNVVRIDKFTLRCPQYDKLDQLYKLIVQAEGEVTATVVLNGEQVGDIVDIQTKYSGVKRGVIVSLDSKINNQLVAKVVIQCLGQL